MPDPVGPVLVAKAAAPSWATGIITEANMPNENEPQEPETVAIPGHGVETIIPDELKIWEDAAAKSA
jgi:hypothetical protein